MKDDHWQITAELQLNIADKNYPMMDICYNVFLLERSAVQG